MGHLMRGVAALLLLGCAAQQVDYGTKMQQTIGSAKIVRAAQLSC